MGGKKVFELTLEIGHKSQLLKSQLPNGYTHKWSIFVKGANNSKLEHCIQRVVFKLHDSFPNPHREITEPPYQVKETGYAGFEIPIEIYFKSRERLEPVEFGLDLILLTDRPNQISRLEKLKFYSPNREFERCLVKAGAQLLSVTKNKKDRSVSPPTKKQKSYSLIPSKDMSNKQAGQQAQSHSHSHSNNNSHSHSSSASLTSHNSILPSSHQTQQQQHHQKSNSSSHLNHNNHGSYNNLSNSNNNHTNIGNNNSGGNSLFSNSYQSNNQAIKRSSQQPSSILPKPKSSSSELMDVFGAPLVYNNNKSQKTSNGKDHSSDHNNRDVPMITSNSRSPIPPPAIRQPSPQVITQQSHTSHQSHSHHHKSSKHHHHHHHKKHHHIKQEPQAETLTTPPPPPPPLSAQLHVPKKTPQKEPPTQQAVAFIAQADPFQIMQNRISSLTDNARLQKIVDIIDESGEWFNLTPNKFEFDLKRLDKKTLSRIEKCLTLTTKD